VGEREVQQRLWLLVTERGWGTRGVGLGKSRVEAGGDRAGEKGEHGVAD
jgi:hypothetical protein